mmetsp:Transcript_12098/g.31056  ORF Transcript_12098/g.31056 Transcript_12098/m.31056 type:complete len:307 (-) Transcript_12098:207-1127(-)
MRWFWRLSLAFAVLGVVTTRAEDDEEETTGMGDMEEDYGDGPEFDPDMMQQDAEMEGMEPGAVSPQQIRSMHGKMDKNTDGKASIDEVLAFSNEMRKIIARKDIRSILDGMDINKDGKVDLDEFLKDMGSLYDEEAGAEDKKEMARRKALETQKFKLADRSGDGMLDVEELPALFYPETHEGVLEFVTLDVMKSKDLNGDGKLTAKEFWQGDAHDPEQRDAEISEEEKEDFKKLDANGDGVIDLAEMKHWESGRFHAKDAITKMFEIADKDKDGHVTADELDAAREQIAGSDAQYHLMEWAEHNEL